MIGPPSRDKRCGSVQGNLEQLWNNDDVSCSMLLLHIVQVLSPHHADDKYLNVNLSWLRKSHIACAFLYITASSNACRPTPGTGASGLDQQTGSDYPSLTGNAHMPPGVPMPGGTAGPTQPSQPMSSAWGPAAKASASQPSVPPSSSRQQQHSAQMPSTSSHADSDFPQGPHPHNAFNGGHGFSGHTQHPFAQTFPPDGTQAQGPYPGSSQTGSFPQLGSSQTGSFPQPGSSQTGSFPQHASQDPRRPSSDQALQSPWGAQGQPVFHPGMLPGGMHPQNMIGAAMHPGSAKLHDSAPGDQLSATHDPIVSPSLIQRGPGAAFTGRSHQLQQQNFNPNAPLQAFAIQEVGHPETAVQAVTLVNNEDQDLEDFMSDIIGLAENGGQEQTREPYMPPGHLTPGALQPGELQCIISFNQALHIYETHSCSCQAHTWNSIDHARCCCLQHMQSSRSTELKNLTSKCALFAC